MSEKTTHDKPRCGRPRSRGRGPCESTILGPNGKCRAHGGWGGAPKGNKNARTTGRFESILFDTMDEEERELAELAAKRQKIDVLNDRIAIATVRERRMMKRIADLKGAGMTMVEETVEAIAADNREFTIPAQVARQLSVDELDEVMAIAATGGTNLPDRITSQLASEDADALLEAVTAAAGQGVIKRKQKHAGTLGQIQAIESDLTAVQTLIARLVTDKMRIENQGAGGAGDDADFDGSLFDEEPDDGEDAG